MLNSFKLKLVAYFVLLSIVPMAAAFWGFTTVAGTSKTRQVDARLQAGLRAALADYQERLDSAQTTAEGLARLRTFQVELERRDRLGLVRLLREAPDVAVVAPGGFRVGALPSPAVRRSVDVVTARGRVGTVVASVALDDALVTSLRSRTGLDPADSLALVEDGRIAAAEPAVSGAVGLAPGETATIRVGGERYRTLLAPALAGAPEARLAVLSPQALIDAADSAARNRILLGLLVCLALVGVVAYLEGRSIVRSLQALAGAAHAIARGRFAERVPVRGRDEFALLGGAFNEMATQLEARLAELEAERARFADQIARFGEALAATHDPAQLRRVIAEAAVEATGASGARLTAADGSVAESGDPDAGGERLELPLVAGRESFGTLVLVGERFDSEQRANAASLASHATIALDNARLHRLVERQALVDGLTGVANRRWCEEALHREVAQAERLGTPLALVLADIDDFKAVNDVHGHAAGDETLRAFADVLRDTVRESDVAGRWGGEEFLLLLPGAEAEGAAQLADRVRLALSGRELDGAAGRFRVTSSFGVAAHRAGVDADALFAAADRALYRAKAAGKDRVEIESFIRSF
ncbi:MAG TPA: diguanylate cyclase [Gaiellaceae bacterium]|nr:diguanylate cyclase [Gaiellaceae bacterium]